MLGATASAVVLGKPIPDSEHAVSVSMPRWADVVAYEEGDAKLLAALESGYPRFVFNRFVAQAMRLAEGELGRPGERAILSPSQAVAERASAFLSKGGCASRWVAWRGLSVVLLPEAGFPLAKAFWQHTGAIVSSRRAQAVLAEGGESATGEWARAELRSRIAQTIDCDAKDVFLFPSGMAALAAAHSALLRRRPGCRTVQMGFPYVDTLKLQEKLGRGAAPILGVSELDHERLEELLAGEPLAGLFTEFPTNPLLQSVDLEAVRAAASVRDVPVVLDDSINAFLFHDFGAHADLLTASLTKYFAGSGDVMGGVLVVNPRGYRASELRRLIEAEFEELLFGDDAVRLEEVSRDFPRRLRRASETAEALCEFLVGHPRVERVYYPKFEFPERYQRCLRTVKPSGASFGALFSVLVKEAKSRAPSFYDALAAAKGPSFGMNVTLTCPYTLLAHYKELEWAASCGIDAQLIRVSVGLEAPAELIELFGEALG